MGCFSSKPAPETPVPLSTPTAQRIQSPAAVPTPPPVASVPSTATLSRHHSRTPSLRQRTHSTGGSSSTSRPRTQSAPQNMPGSSSRDRRRAQTLAPGERSDPVPRMPNIGESDAWPGNEPSITALSAHSKAGTRSLTSTMHQVLSNHRRYVAPLRHLNDVPLIPCRFRILVVGKVHSRNSQPNPGQVDTALNHRKALANPRSSIQSSK